MSFEGNATTFRVTGDFHDWNGQTNTFMAITDENSTSTFASVDTLTLDIKPTALVGPGIRLTNNPRGVTLKDMPYWYNYNGFYNGTAGYNCGVHLNLSSGNYAQDIVLSGTVGGDNSREVYANTQVGVNIVGANTRVDTSGVVNGGIATTGTLISGGFLNTVIRVEDANFSLKQRVDGCDISHLGAITANRTITLDLAGARDGDEWSVYRESTGAFNLNVAGVITYALTAPGKWCKFRYYQAVNQARLVSTGG